MSSGSAPRRLSADLVYVGWRYAQAHPDPGPPPRRPRPPDAERPVPGLAQAHRHAQGFVNRPLRVAAAGTAAGMLLFLATGVGGVLPWRFAAVGLIACAMIAGIIGYALLQSELLIRTQVRNEQDRLERAEAARMRRLNAAHEEHAAAYREWQDRRRAYEDQREWHPVTVPPGADRVDIAGGTLAGWAAAVTTMGAARLAVGSEVTVLDLSEGAVAHDLVRLAADRGDDPLVWVLPADLPRLDLTKGLGAEAMADVLSLVVSAGEERGTTRDLSFDNAILERVISVFGGTATVPQITAALRALAQVGDPRDDVDRGLISDDQLDRVNRLFGRGAADRVVIERAWALESQLRKLEDLGTEPVRLPPSRLRVISMDRRAGVLTNRILGTYVATALTHALRDAPAGRRWDHTLFLCGAEKLRGDVLDRLTHACEATGTGLVLMYRSLPAHVRSRLGRAHAAVGFMRLGNAADARAAAEHIGTGRRLRIAEITDTAGEVIPHYKDDAYASTVAYARIRGGEPLTDPVWSPLPEPVHDPQVLAERIISSTAWGHSVAGSAEHQPSRELVLEPHELQQLPPTAMVFTHAMGSGRQLMLVDSNPGIMTLPTTHVLDDEGSGQRRPTIEAHVEEGPEEGEDERPGERAEGHGDAAAYGTAGTAEPAPPTASPSVPPPPSPGPAAEDGPGTEDGPAPEPQVPPLASPVPPVPASAAIERPHGPAGSPDAAPDGDPDLGRDRAQDGDALPPAAQGEPEQPAGTAAAEAAASSAAPTESSAEPSTEAAAEPSAEAPAEASASTSAEASEPSATAPVPPLAAAPAPRPLADREREHERDPGRERGFGRISSRARHAAPRGGARRARGGTAQRSAGGDASQPNLGPPPERLDFRRKKR